MTPAETQPGGWLGDHAAAFLLTVPVDCESCILSIGRRYARRPMAMSHQRYEVNRGLPRILDLLADLRLPATFFVPGWTLERHPAVAESIVAAGHELAHHSYSHRKPVELSADEERADFERALAALDRLGVTPRGHRAAYWCPSPVTLELVAEYGLAYDCSLMGDDRPYVVPTAHGDVVELPPFWGLDDWEQYAWLPDPDIGANLEQPHAAVDVWRAELHSLRRHGGLLQLTCHAFLTGRPGRVEALRGLLEEAIGLGDVAFWSCAEAAQRARLDPTLPRREVPGGLVHTRGEEWS